MFDGGIPVRTPGPEYNYETFRSYILASKSAAPQVQLLVDAEVDSLDGAVDITVCGVDSTPAETLRLFVVLVEDSVRATLPGATDSVFNSVMRAMLPDENGRPVTLARGDTLRFREAFGLAPFWVRRLLGAVVFVQHADTRRVLQAAGVRRLEDVKGVR